MAIPDKFPARTPETLLSLIRQHFPELHWTKYKLITIGWDHDVLILDNSIVFRFPNDQYNLALLESETRLLKSLRPLVSVNIPDYTFIVPDHAFVGYPLILGQTLSRRLFDTLGHQTHTQIAQQLAELLSTMHNMPSKGYDLTYIPGWDFAEEQAETKQHTAQYLPAVLSEQDFALVQRILSEVDKLLSKPLPRVFIHGDIYSEHLLWDEASQRLGVIDFSDMSHADPALDFAELYEYGEGFVQKVYGFYTGTKDNGFLERAWVYQHWAGVYMMTDHFVYHKTSFEVARQTFDRVKLSL